MNPTSWTILHIAPLKCSFHAVPAIDIADSECMYFPDGPLELHTLSLLPSLRQVVFKGDRLPFHCTAALVDKITTLHWLHKGQQVINDPKNGVHLEESVLHDCTFITR